MTEPELRPAGETWRWHASNEQPLRIAGDTLFKVVYEGVKGFCIHTSRDYGRTWSCLSDTRTGLGPVYLVNVENAGRTLVYLFGTGKTYTGSISPGSKHEWTLQLWVSEDSMKSFKLVNPAVVLQPWQILSTFYGPGESLYVYVRVEKDSYDCLASQDGGVTWRRVWSRTDSGISTDTPVSFGAELFAFGWVPNISRCLVKSLDSGKTWNAVEGEFVGDEMQIVYDPRFNRLVLFTESNMYELESSSQAWRKLQSWRSTLPINRLFEIERLTAAVFTNGNILLQVSPLAKSAETIVMTGVSVPQPRQDFTAPAMERFETITVRHIKISLKSYAVCEDWQLINTTDDDMFVIGETLYRVREMECDPCNAIEASRDYGSTWSSYARMPFCLDGCNFVHASGATVYLLGGYRCDRPYMVRKKPRYSKRPNPVAEVWVSFDLMRTFSLVTNSAGFGANEVIQAFTGQDGTLYATCKESRNPNNSSHAFTSWMSKDGKSWTRITQVDDTREPIGNSFATLGNLKYTVRTQRGRSKYELCVMDTSGEGELWRSLETENCLKETPVFLVADQLYGRLICFTHTNSYELSEGSHSWKLLGDTWLSAFNKQSSASSPYRWIEESYCFASGAILLKLNSHTPQETRFVLSKPNVNLAADHKAILIAYLRNFNVDEALFDATIAPFLFPY